MITIKEALHQGTQAIKMQQVSQTPLLDASLLLSKTTALSRELLYSRSDMVLTTELLNRFKGLIQSRCSGQPIAYLTGEREFYGRTFVVSPAVLIPRMDTETLIEAALAKLPSHVPTNVLDLCTGSGCIGITIAAERPLATVTLSDISNEALEIAQLNAQRIVKTKVNVCQSDLFSALQNQKFSMIVTNPPYLSEHWYDQTERQVKAEPALALLGGDHDGLAIIRKVIEQAPCYLEDQGRLFLECDYRQHDAVAQLLKTRGFSAIEGHDDLSSLRRVVSGVYTCMKN